MNDEFSVAVSMAAYLKSSSRALKEGVAIQKPKKQLDCHVANDPRNDDRKTDNLVHRIQIIGHSHQWCHPELVSGSLLDAEKSSA